MLRSLPRGLKKLIIRTETALWGLGSDRVAVIDLRFARGLIPD